MQMNACSLFICFGQPLYRVHTTDDVNWRATFHATQKLDKLCSGYQLLCPRLTATKYCRAQVPGGVDA